MGINELFNELETTLRLYIPYKIDQKIKQIKDSSRNEIQKIEKKFIDTQFEKGSKHLNDLRESYIEIVNKNLKSEIDQVNCVYKDMLKYIKCGTFIFEELLTVDFALRIVLIKSKQVGFKPNQRNAYHSATDLNRISYKFHSNLDLIQLNKYCKFIFSKKNFIKPFRSSCEYDIYATLPLKKIFILDFQINHDCEMFIINDRGKKLHSSSINATYKQVKASTNKLIINFPIKKEIYLLEEKKNILYKVYDMRLKEMYDFLIDSNYSQDYKIFGNEIVFEYCKTNNVMGITNKRESKKVKKPKNKNNEANNVLIFNLDNRKRYKIKLDNINENTSFYTNNFHAVHLNKQNLYIFKFNDDDYSNNSLYILNRNSCDPIANIPIMGDRYTIKFDFNSQIYSINTADKSIKMFNSNGEFINVVKYDKLNIGSIELSVYQTYISEKYEFDENNIEFEEY